MEPFLSINAAMVVLGLLKKKALDKGADSALKALFHGESSVLQLSQQRIETKVQAIAKGPMEAGLFWLEHASQPSHTSADRRKSLDLAVVRFVDAYAQLDGSEKARAVLLAAFTFQLLGDSGESTRCMQTARAILDQLVDSSLAPLKHRMVRTTKPLLPFLEAFDESQRLLPTLNELIGRDAIEWTLLKASKVVPDAEAGTLTTVYWLMPYRNGEQRGEIDISAPTIDGGAAYLGGLPDWVYTLPVSQLL